MRGLDIDNIILRYRLRLASVSPLIAILLMLTYGGTMFAIELGHIDDFEDGTEQNWIWGRGGFGGPVAISGGQQGSIYLETESFGGDDAPGSRMAIINREQWTGDFLAAGVHAIRLDAFNDGPNFAFADLALRIGFSSESASIGSGRVVTTDVFRLARGDGWQTFEFDLTDLTSIAGSDAREVLSSVSEMRIISAEEPRFIGDQFIARLGLDNIAAVAVPEPNSWDLSWASLLGFAVTLRQRRSLGHRAAPFTIASVSGLRVPARMRRKVKS